MAIGLSVTDDVGGAAAYHRIESVEYDFERMQVHITVKSYADETYRAAEKTQIAQTEAAAARRAQLSAKETLTNEERNELTALDIRELDACKYTQRHMRTQRMTLELSDDIRAGIYGRISLEIPLFAQGTLV